MSDEMEKEIVEKEDASVFEVESFLDTLLEIQDDEELTEKLNAFVDTIVENAEKAIKLTSAIVLDRPKMKTIIGIDYVHRLVRKIGFYATEDLAEWFEEFGILEQSNSYDEKWELEVDPRFNFDEVHEYILRIMEESRV